MNQVIDELVKTLLTAIAPVIAAGVVAVLALLMKKLGLQISAENQARTEKLVHDAVFMAEEHTAALVKKGITPVVPKLQAAVSHIVDKAPGITRAEAERLVEQELPKLGLGAASFTRSMVQAATNDTK